MDTIWTLTAGKEGDIYKLDYTAFIKGNGYQVRVFAPEMGRGDNFYPSTRCEPVGEPGGYSWYGLAILACLEHAGIEESGQHYIKVGEQLASVQFSPPNCVGCGEPVDTYRAAFRAFTGRGYAHLGCAS